MHWIFPVINKFTTFSDFDSQQLIADLVRIQNDGTVEVDLERSCICCFKIARIPVILRVNSEWKSYSWRKNINSSYKLSYLLELGVTYNLFLPLQRDFRHVQIHIFGSFCCSWESPYIIIDLIASFEDAKSLFNSFVFFPYLFLFFLQRWTNITCRSMVIVLGWQLLKLLAGV